MAVVSGHISCPAAALGSRTHITAVYPAQQWQWLTRHRYCYCHNATAPLSFPWATSRVKRPGSECTPKLSPLLSTMYQYQPCASLCSFSGATLSTITTSVRFASTASTAASESTTTTTTTATTTNTATDTTTTTTTTNASVKKDVPQGLTFFSLTQRQRELCDELELSTSIWDEEVSCGASGDANSGGGGGGVGELERSILTLVDGLGHRPFCIPFHKLPATLPKTREGLLQADIEALKHNFDLLASYTAIPEEKFNAVVSVYNDAECIYFVFVYVSAPVVISLSLSRYTYLSLDIMIFSLSTTLFLSLLLSFSRYYSLSLFLFSLIFTPLYYPFLPLPPFLWAGVVIYCYVLLIVDCC